MSTSIHEQRLALHHRLIGPKIPRLWCPPLTHYTATGEIDTERITAHWRFMNPAVGGFLVPGSTGDGWEMTDAEIDQSLALAITLAQDYNSRILVGVLRTSTGDMLSVIQRVTQYLKHRAGCEDILDAMESLKVCGFTVCPPEGEMLTQADLQAGLTTVLDTGLPVALYQLPQITHNEMSADLVADLAEAYANFILFKDSSGSDHVAQSGEVAQSVFLVRGAEGAYAPSLIEMHGAYDGLLLSTANCFPTQLRNIIDLLEAGHLSQAQHISDTLTRIIDATFKIVSAVPVGNAFTNANKTLEHWMAWGIAGDDQPEPMLHAGQKLPRQVLDTARSVLHENDMFPATGYLLE